MELEFVKKYAGLLTESSHEQSEKELFDTACEAMTKIKQMCKDRLTDKNLSAEHKQHYTKLLSTAEAFCSQIEQHIKSYK